MLKFTQKGNWEKTERFLKTRDRIDPYELLERYGRQGVYALAANTPFDSGETKNSWRYTVEKTRRGYALSWYNTKMAGRTPLVILLQYGHGTRGGTFVQGRDFINPAIRPILDSISEELRKEVSSK